MVPAICPPVSAKPSTAVQVEMTATHRIATKTHFDLFAAHFVAVIELVAAFGPLYS
jgi:hypothetical protein